MTAPRLLTVAEVCDRLKLGRTTVYLLIADGRLPSFRVGRARRIPEDALAAFVAEHTSGGAA